MNVANIDYLRVKKRDLLLKRYEIFKRNNKPLRVVEIDDGTVIPFVPNMCNEGSYECGVLNDQFNFIPESGDIDFPNLVEDYGREHSAETGQELTVMYCGHLTGHWGHFITDNLSRLWAAVDGKYEFDRIVFVRQPGENNTPVGNILECLKMLHLDSKIDIIESPVRYKKILVPESGCIPRHHFSSDTTRVYDLIAEEAMKGASDDYPDKIFMSRSKLDKALKVEYDLKWFDRFFLSNGYAIIYPEQLDIKDTIRYIRKAQTVAAFSGTLPHNMLFGNPGQNITIIEKYANINNYQPGIDLIRNLNVTYVDANALIWSVSAGYGPFIVYPNKWLQKFAADHQMIMAEPWDESHLRHILRDYFREFKRHYGYQWFMNEWLEEEIELLREAYRDSYKDFGGWLDGSKPLFIKDIISLRNFAKRIYHKLKH